MIKTCLAMYSVLVHVIYYVSNAPCVMYFNIYYKFQKRKSRRGRMVVRFTYEISAYHL